MKKLIDDASIVGNLVGLEGPTLGERLRGGAGSLDAVLEEIGGWTG